MRANRLKYDWRGKKLDGLPVISFIRAGGWLGEGGQKRGLKTHSYIIIFVLTKRTEFNSIHLSHLESFEVVSENQKNI